VNGLPPLSTAREKTVPRPLVKACQEFESLFLNTLLREGRATAGGDSSQAMKITEDMRDEALSREMAKAGGMGLGKLIQNQLMKTP